MNQETRDMNTEAFQAFEQFKEVHGRIQEEVKKIGDETGESRQQLNRLHNRLDEIETKFSRPQLSQGVQPSELEVEEKKYYDAFNHFCLTKDDTRIKQVIHESKQLSLNETIDPDGGYLVPPSYYNQIVDSLIQFSPMRDLATVVNVTGKEFRVPVQADAQDPRTGARRRGMFQTGWTGDMGPVNSTEIGQFRMETIFTKDMYALPPMSTDVLEDNQYNLMSYVNVQLGKSFAYDEGEAFVKGETPDRPVGILTNFPAEQTISSGVATGFPPFDAANGGNAASYRLFTKMYYTLPDFYARNGTWLMNRFTIQLTREFIDSQGQPLWTPTYGNTMPNSAPFSFLGRPYQEMIDFPAPDENGEFTEGDTMVLFGDIKSAYMIVDRVGISMREDPYTQKPFILLYTRKRVGGQRILSEAVVRLVADGTEG